MMSDCIIWHKSLNDTGYGQIWHNGRRYRAHRLAWQSVYGEIPKGYFVDHNCHNEAVSRGECEGGYSCKHRACINIDHLQLVTNRENIMLGIHNRDNRATCPKGHENNEANTMVRKSGKRECAECNRIRARAVWANRMKVA